MLGVEGAGATRELIVKLSKKRLRVGSSAPKRVEAHGPVIEAHFGADQACPVMACRSTD